ncbi:MAG: rhodanese-related sulfurtransferase [Puniceicoccaceae bacterium]
MPDSNFQIGAFYKFFHFPQFAEYRGSLFKQARELSITGSLLLAHEGVNGTLAGPPGAVAALIGSIEKLPGAAPIEVKWSFSATCPFYRLKVRLKKEIVTFGVGELLPEAQVGEYVEPKDWNALISDPEVMVIDTRNAYEVRLGKFRRAIDPETESFREFSSFVDEQLDPSKTRKVAMYCTGGIRCEKATAYLHRKGFEGVYHLRGGILKYLEEIPPEESLWEGECFVFDQRVSVGHALRPGDLDLCGGCREPLTEEDRALPGYERGVSCHQCVDQLSDEKKAGARERQRQIELAKARGDRHLGSSLDGR